MGLMSDRGRGNIQSYVGNVVYTIVAMGMLSTVSWWQEPPVFDKPPGSVEGPSGDTQLEGISGAPHKPPPGIAATPRFPVCRFPQSDAHHERCTMRPGCACLCVGLQISGVKVYGGPDRLVFYREASTGLSKLAYFLALDTWSLVGGCACVCVCVSETHTQCTILGRPGVGAAVWVRGVSVTRSPHLLLEPAQGHQRSPSRYRFGDD